jgi:RNA polymerase II subunit A-like phosphatase
MEQACAHPSVWNGICNLCGELASAAHKRKMSARDAGWGDFQLSEHELRRLESEAQGRLVKEKKLQLVLDLDETLINTVRKPHVQRARELTDAVVATGGVEGLQLRDFHLLPNHPDHFMKLRPGVDEFLQVAAQMYELCIFTKGSRPYAADVTKILDPTGTLFRDRIISSTECSDFAKDLQTQYPCPDTMVVIVDDREDVWEQSNPGNVLRVVPYHFWLDTWEIDQNRDPPAVYPSAAARMRELATYDATDEQLKHVLGVLRDLHSQFYASSAIDLEKRDVKSLIAARRKSVLCGVEIVFSGCFKKPIPGARNRYQVQDNELWRKVEAFGAKCSEELTASVTHVVAKKYGTEKVQRAIKQNIALVHLDWVKESVKSWRKRDERDFLVQDVLTRPRFGGFNHAWFPRGRPGPTIKPPEQRYRAHRIRRAAGASLDSDSDSGGVSSSGESGDEGDTAAAASVVSPVGAVVNELGRDDDDDDDDDDDSSDLAEDLENFLGGDTTDDDGQLGDFEDRSQQGNDRD